MNKIIIVVDMQNDFITGSLGGIEAQNTILKIKKVLEKAVKDGDKIVFTQDTHFANYMETLEGKKLPVPHCIKGTKGWDIIDELKEFVNPQLTIEKMTFGYDNWFSFLEKEFPSQDEIVLVGVCTDICVVSNALIIRSIYPNLKISVIEECCAGVTNEKHNSALEVMASCQIDII